MTRLIPAALYSNPMGELHHARAIIYSKSNSPCDITDYEGIWERAAKRIDTLDPEGREAYAVLKHLKELDRYSAWSNALAQKIASEKL